MQALGKSLFVLGNVGDALLAYCQRRVIAVCRRLLDEKQCRTDGQSAGIEPRVVPYEHGVKHGLQIIVGMLALLRGHGEYIVYAIDFLHGVTSGLVIDDTQPLTPHGFIVYAVKAVYASAYVYKARSCACGNLKRRIDGNLDVVYAERSQVEVYFEQPPEIPDDDLAVNQLQAVIVDTLFRPFLENRL